MQPDLIDRKQAEDLAEAITAVQGVAGLDSGRFGEVALLFPGARVKGLHVAAPKSGDQSPRFEVSIVADATDEPNLDELAARVRDVAASKIDLPVDVTVADVVRRAKSND